jgi:hypothetical protein
LRVEKDMSISHAEFFRSLAHLLRGEDFELRGDGATIRRGPGTVEIRLGPEGQRRLGNFALPRTPVEIVFDGCPDAEARVFLKRFDDVFRRGGG